ncbi:MAG: hypothetical protein V7609_1137 [Verrucomicrobiota bacterium]
MDRTGSHEGGCNQVRDRPGEWFPRRAFSNITKWSESVHETGNVSADLARGSGEELFITAAEGPKP